MYLAFVEGNRAFDWRVAVGDNSNQLLEDLSAKHHEETAVAMFMHERFDFDSPLVNPMTMTEILYAIGLTRDKLSTTLSKQIREFISLRTNQRKAELRRVNGEVGRYWMMPAERVTASGGMPFKPQLEVVPSPSEDEPDFI